MRYTVLWRESALHLLADLWTNAADRNSITNMSHEAERSLAQNPESLGEEYYGDRLLIVGRLAVTFQILVDDRIVEIIDIYWHPI